jgi:hypothetical protein
MPSRICHEHVKFMNHMEKKCLKDKTKTSTFANMPYTNQLLVNEEKYTYRSNPKMRAFADMTKTNQHCNNICRGAILEGAVLKRVPSRICNEHIKFMKPYEKGFILEGTVLEQVTSQICHNSNSVINNKNHILKGAVLRRVPSRICHKHIKFIKPRKKSLFLKEQS